MSRLILDSGGVSFLAGRSKRALSTRRRFERLGLSPPVVPSVVVVESTSGRSGPDATVNRFLKTCHLVEQLPERRARRAGALRHLAGRGSAADAVVVATAEPDGIVLSGDLDDLGALAAHARGVRVEEA